MSNLGPLVPLNSCKCMFKERLSIYGISNKNLVNWPLVHHYIAESPLVLGVGSLSCIFSEIEHIHQGTMII